MMLNDLNIGQNNSDYDFCCIWGALQVCNPKFPSNLNISHYQSYGILYNFVSDKS